MRAALGIYTHDLKNTLGLVSGSNAILPRIAAGQPQILEMTGIIQKASGQIDDLIMLLVEYLNNQIDTGEY